MNSYAQITLCHQISWYPTGSHPTAAASLLTPHAPPRATASQLSSQWRRWERYRFRYYLRPRYLSQRRKTSHR